VSPLVASVKADVSTAYIYRGVTYTDRPVAQITPQVDFFLAEWFCLGGWAWQNYDLSGQRRGQGVRGEWNETDYEAHVGFVPWSEGRPGDRDFSALNFTAGYSWEVYVVHGTYPWGERKRKYSPTLRYANFTADFTNPVVTPYASLQVEHISYHTVMAEGGLRKDIPLADLTGWGALADFSLGLKASLFGGHRRALALLFGVDDAKTGVSAMEGTVSLDWHPTKALTIGAGVSYTSIIASRIAHGIRDDETRPGYMDHVALVWGGLHAVWAF